MHTTNNASSQTQRKSALPDMIYFLALFTERRRYDRPITNRMIRSRITPRQSLTVWDITSTHLVGSVLFRPKKLTWPVTLNMPRPGVLFQGTVTFRMVCGKNLLSRFKRVLGMAENIADFYADGGRIMHPAIVLKAQDRCQRRLLEEA